MEELVEIYGEPVSVYTRKQAIEDGVLVDVTEWANDGPNGMMGGFTCPTVITRNLWEKIEAPKRSNQDTRGRAHDVLWMAAGAARRAGEKFRDGARIPFGVKIGPRLIYPRVVLDGDGVTIGLPEDF